MQWSPRERVSVGVFGEAIYISAVFLASMDKTKSMWHYYLPLSHSVSDFEFDIL